MKHLGALLLALTASAASAHHGEPVVHAAENGTALAFALGLIAIAGTLALRRARAGRR